MSTGGAGARGGRLARTGGAGARERHLSPPPPRKPNTLKQKNGFPPNFIHSLDSSHMMLTALHCYRWALLRDRPCRLGALPLTC